MSRDIKNKLYFFCKTYINERIHRLKDQIEDLKSGLGSETKSSAGDKHETGRAMLQLELEKLGKQLYEAESLFNVLQQVPQESKPFKIALGSLVTTDKGVYYLAISAGKYEDPEHVVFCISASTPIGKLLLGKEIKDHFLFNGVRQRILEIG